MRYTFQQSKDIVLAAAYEALAFHAEYDFFSAELVHKRLERDFSAGFVRRLLKSLADERLVSIDQYDETSSPHYTLSDTGLQYVEGLPPLSRLLKLAAEPSIPASNRIVTLGHNQVDEFSQSISVLVEEIEKDNGVPDHPGLRERLLGQIKAGKELIISGQFKAYLLYEVLVRALNEIIEKYGNETIKSLANALLGAIVSKLFEGQ